VTENLTIGMVALTFGCIAAGTSLLCPLGETILDMLLDARRQRFFRLHRGRLRHPAKQK